MEKYDLEANPPKRTIANEVIVRFGERLKEAMNGESNYSLAKRSGLSERVIRQYIKGASYPTLDTLVSLSISTNTSIEWLSTGKLPTNMSNHELKDINRNEHPLLKKWIDIFNIMSDKDKEIAINNLMANGYKILLNRTEENNGVANIKEVILNHLKQLNTDDVKEILSYLESDLTETPLSKKRA